MYELWLDDGYVVHAPVGTFRGNAFGLHDVVGNVWEWCRDGMAGYDEIPPRDGDGLRSVPSPRSRVYRGGGFDAPASVARSGFRYAYTPENCDDGLGLRPARSCH